MQLLRDLWRRTAFAQYFEALEPIDRATFWIAVVLAFAIGICWSKIWATPAEPATAIERARS